MRIIGNAGKAREVQAVASGVLPSGKPVIVNADGTVSVAGTNTVTETVGSNVVFEAGYALNIDSAYDSNAQKVVVAYRDADNSSRGTAVVGTISGTSLSFGTPVVFDTSNSQHIGIAYDANAQKMVIAYGVSGVAGFGIVGTVSGTTISFGTRVSLGTTAQDCSVAYDSSAQKVVVSFKNSSNNYGSALVGTVSGTSISFGTLVVFASHVIYETKIAYDSTNSKVVIAYTNASQQGVSIVGTVSGTNISFGSAVVFDAGEITALDVAYDVASGKSVIVYQKGPGGNQGANAIVGTISGTGISFGTAVVYDSGSGNENNTIVYHEAAEKVIVVYWDNSNSDRATALTGTVSGTTISFANSVVLEQGASNYISPAYDSTNKVVFVALRDGGNSNYGTGVVYQPTYSSINLTAENYIGMSGGVVTGSVSAVGTPAVSSTVQSSYFGSTFDSNSNKVVVTYWDQTNSKGMAVVGTVSGTSISFGTPVEYSSQSAFTYPQGVVFDSNSNKVVIAYVDSGGSSYGTAIVGTVSGTSISFGTAVVFESASTAYPEATFDNVNNKVIIIYEDGGDSDKGKAVVGTVSGTSISFGSTATFNAGGTSYPAVAYDTNAQKVVVAYRDKSASDHGKAVVGTVSGTSISFGSATTFNAANTNYNIVVYDEAAQKVVVYYQGADTNMEAIVGTVSGTSISFGTAAEFSASNSTNMSATYAANAAKTVVFYRSAINSNYGTYNVGTISGTSISFSDPIVFEEADSRFTTATYDSGNEKVIVSYEDVGNSQYATSTVINVGYINRGQVADGGNAEINIKGAVAENQVGLTAGQSYYVQTDGTLSTTAGDPSVFAGTAVAATKLIVKG